MATPNEDPGETERFDAVVDWWDPDGALRPLHDLQPARLEWLEERLQPLAGKRVLDVGCGGGLLAEALAHRGAQVVGIDTSSEAIRAAKLHALEQGIESVTYQVAGIEAYRAAREPGASGFDAVVCMELLEHVPEPDRLVTECAELVEPGGHLCLSTLNRTTEAWLLGIVAAEHLLGLLPRGTHRHDRFVRPSELAAWGRRAGLVLEDLRGMRYNPFARRAWLSDDVSINYLADLVRP